MQGYTVVTSDGDKIGTVVEERGANLIVETGTLRKHRHAIPKMFVHAQDADQQVSVTVTKDIVSDSPLCDDGVDEAAVAAHYGLAEPYAETAPLDAPVTDPMTREAEEQRARMREGETPSTDVPQVHERSRSAVDPLGVDANR